jgi:hypothetical protein
MPEQAAKMSRWAVAAANCWSTAASAVLAVDAAAAELHDATPVRYGGNGGALSRLRVALSMQWAGDVGRCRSISLRPSLRQGKARCPPPSPPLPVFVANQGSFLPPAARLVVSSSLRPLPPSPSPGENSQLPDASVWATALMPRQADRVTSSDHQTVILSSSSLLHHQRAIKEALTKGPDPLVPLQSSVEYWYSSVLGDTCLG